MSSSTAPPRLRVGLVGCGNIAVGHHLPAYPSRPDLFEVVAVADPTPGRRALAAEVAGLDEDAAHEDVEDLLARADVDLVDVCTPQHLHAPVVLAAARSGRHVVCEKPLAAVPAEAAAMTQVARDAGTVLAVVHNYLFFPEVAAAREVVASGEIGAVRAVTVDFLGVVDSPGAAGYLPQWRKDPAASGGGVLVDMLHAVYLAEHLLGERARRVSAYVDAAHEGARVEDLALVRLETGRSAALVGTAWGHGEGGLQVLGTTGRLSVRYARGATQPWAPFEEAVVVTDAGERVLDLPSGAALREQVLAGITAALVDVAGAVHEGRPPAAGGDDGLHALEVCLAAYASAATGHLVRVPLDVDGPLHRRGATGLGELDLDEDGLVRRRGLLGVDPAPADRAGTDDAG